MKSYSFILVLLFSVFQSFAQTLSGSVLNTILQGEKYCIKSQGSPSFYALFSNNDLNHDSLVTTFTSFKILDLGNDENLIVQLIFEQENYESTIEIFDLNTGKDILPQSREVKVSIVSEKQVIIVNSENKNAKIIDVNGKTLFSLDNTVLEYSPKGFYNSEYLLDDFTETFYDKQGNILSKSDYIVLQIIDKQSLIVRKPSDVNLIIDSNDQTLFKDECAADFTIGRTHYNKIPFLLSTGLCGQGDDVTLLMKSKNGKWHNPIKKINKSYWVNYIQPIDKFWSTEDIIAFYVIADDKGMLLNEKGNIKVEIENPELAKNITYYGPFIYVYTETDFGYKVYLRNGNALILDEGTSSLKLNEANEAAGYFIFENKINHLAYIYNENSHELVTFSREKLQFNSLKELELLFKKHLSDQK